MDIKTILISFAIMALFCSCASNVPVSRLSRMVELMDEGYTTMSDERWDAMTAQYEEVLKEIEEHYDSYSVEEKDEICRLIGRYNALRVKRLANDAGSIVEEIGRGLESIVDGFLQGLSEEGSAD